MSNKPKAFKDAQRKKKESNSIFKVIIWAVIITIVGLSIFFYMFMN